MGKTIGIVVGVAVLLVVTVIFTLSPRNGRFQLYRMDVDVIVVEEDGSTFDTVRQPDIFKLDTSTGEMWLLSTTLQGPVGDRKLVYYWKNLDLFAPEKK